MILLKKIKKLVISTLNVHLLMQQVKKIKIA